MFAVVVFINKNEVEVVPTSWLSVDQKVSFWPPYKSMQRAKQAVQNQEEPDETWDEHFIRVLKKYDCYEAARKKLVKATRKDSLTSEDEGAKRLRIPSVKLADQLVPPVPPRPRTANRKTASSSTQPQQLQPPPEFPPQPVWNPPAASQSDTSLLERDQMIFRALEDIKAQVRQNTLLLQALARKQPAQTATSLSDDFKFPLQSLDELRKVEKVLADKAQQKALTSYLATLGGVNPGDTVRRIMRHLLSDALAIQFNWLGRGGQKRAFSALSITAVIRGATAVQNLSASECEVHIKNWLKYSSDRNGGRKRRAEQHGPVNEQSSSSELDSDSELEA